MCMAKQVVYRIKVREDDPPHIVEIIEQFNQTIDDEEDFNILLGHVNTHREHWKRSQEQLSEVKRRQYGKPY